MGTSLTQYLTHLLVWQTDENIKKISSHERKSVKTKQQKVYTNNEEGKKPKLRHNNSLERKKGKGWYSPKIKLEFYMWIFSLQFIFGGIILPFLPT